MEFITEAVPYDGTGWRTASLAVPVSTLHALYKQTAEVVCLGVDRKGPDRELDRGVVCQLLSAIDAQLDDGGFPGDHGVTPRRSPGFDSLGHLSGSERRFTDGWSNDLGVRVVHVFPCFACELSSAWPTHKFASVVRKLDVFDISRNPNPYIEIKMRGGKSKLLLKKWPWDSLRSTLIYAKILGEEPEGVLEVRNLMGDVVVFSRENGWHAYEERIAAHALRSSNSQ